MKNFIFCFLIFTFYCGGTVERTVLPQPTTETEELVTEIEEPKIETEEPKTEKKPKKLKKEVNDTLKEYGYKK